MFWLIETDKQLDYLKNRGFDKAFVEIIPYNFQEHPCINNICAIYIRPLDETKGFIMPITHSETLSVSIDNVLGVLNEINSIYVRDKKESLHYFIHKNTYDITLHSPTYIHELPQIYSWFNKMRPNRKDVNRLIPIAKHYEYCSNLFTKLKENIDGEFNMFFNTKAPMVFNALERSGIRINRKKFAEAFYLPDSDYIFTQYNFKTLTRRPSNKFKGVNYAALSKKNNDRECFIPRNDIFLELDIRAYHPSLLAKLIKYDFGCDDIHQSFSEMYGVDYNKAKEITFKQLYGGVFDEYKDLEFFRKVTEYVNILWKEFNEVGEIKVPISEWRIKKEEVSEMTPQKLLNYLLQGLETAMNVRILWDVIKILRGKKTKIVLYTYDSFLLDFSKDEKELYQLILDVFKKYKLKTKMSYGNNYKF
tara:strand:+ start:1127 stop:2383 length:1257 start_codon:yes stop_codon:yes gene_type:complete